MIKSKNEGVNNMKIAFVSPGFVPVPAVEGGAIEKLMTYLIEQNEEKQHFEIDLYTIDHPEIHNMNFDGTNMYRIKLNFIGKCFDRIFNHFFWKYGIEKSFNQFGRKVSKIIQKQNYDYILVENNMYLYKKLHSTVTAKYPSTQFLYHLHNDIGKVDKPISLCKYILTTASCVITCSNYLKTRLLHVMDTDKVKVLYNVINFNKLIYSEVGRNKIRKLHNLKDEFLYGYIGRISQEKGVLELVKAFKKRYHKNKKLKLMIIGDTLFKNTGSKYLNLVNKEISDISDAVICTGSISNDKINEYMSAIDALVIPTICEEAFGIVAAEGLACERPILATQSGGMVEILNEGTALIIDKNNIIDELNNGMKIVEENYEEYLQKSKKGRKQIIKNKQFHYDKYLENFHEILVRNNK